MCETVRRDTTAVGIPITRDERAKLPDSAVEEPFQDSCVGRFRIFGVSSKNSVIKRLKTELHSDSANFVCAVLYALRMVLMDLLTVRGGTRASALESIPFGIGSGQPRVRPTKVLCSLFLGLT